MGLIRPASKLMYRRASSLDDVLNKTRAAERVNHGTSTESKEVTGQRDSEEQLISPEIIVPGAAKLKVGS